MPHNPFVKPPSVDKRIMPARSALYAGGGVPAGETLNNWQPEELVDGAICFVHGETALYRFDKFSVVAPATNVTVTTIKGVGVPGRWILLLSPALPKAFRALSYAAPNASGADSPIASIVTLASTWSRFDPIVFATELDASGDLSFDGNKGIVADRAMTVQIDWYLSWWITSGAAYLWDCGCLLNGVALQTPVPGSICSDYYNPEAIPNQDSVMTSTTIVNLAPQDTLELMVRTIGPVGAPSTLVADHCTLVVTEL
jgi:hypothetical protein